MTDVVSSVEEICIPPHESVYFLGQALIAVIQGKIDILGKNLGSVDGFQRAMSLPTTALLSVSNISDEEAIIHVKSLFNGLENMTLSKGEHVLGIDSQKLGKTFVINPTGRYQYFQAPKEWSGISDAFHECNEHRIPIVLVCGPRKVGKSTLGRFLTNRLSNYFSRVAYMDLDIGQTEYTVPGFMSLHLLKEPLLGPPIHHTGSTTHSHYFGSSGVNCAPRHYYECMKSLFHIYQTEYYPLGIPLFVNTMGWVTGLGFLLLQQIIQTIRPSHLIAIKPDAPEHDNCVPDYVWEALYSKSEFWNSECFPLKEDEPINVAAVYPAAAAGSDIDRSFIDPAELRSITWLTYFHREDFSFYQSPAYNFTKLLGEFIPLQISWSNVMLSLPAFSTIEEFTAIPAMLNHAVVGLATIDVTDFSMPFTKIGSLRVHRGSYLERPDDCVGAAIIRAIDPVKQVFHIITPIPLDELKRLRLNKFIFNPGYLYPKNLLIQAHNTTMIASHNPYFSAASSFSGSTAKTRKVRGNINRKRPHK